MDYLHFDSRKMSDGNSRAELDSGFGETHFDCGDLERGRLEIFVVEID